MSLDTLTNVKARLGVSGSSDDTLLGLLMDAADDRIAQHVGRDFGGGTFTEYFPGGSTLLILANFPVSSVTSVKVDPSGGFGSTSVVASSGYAVHVERGVIESKAGPFGAGGSPRAVQVVYATATSSVPDDVKQAYALLIAHWYRQVKTRVAAGFQHLHRQRYGDVTVTFQPDQFTAASLPPEVEELLAPYRTPRV